MGRLTTDSEQVSGGSGRVDHDVLAEAKRSCYKARDAFYACLEKKTDTNPTEVTPVVDLIYPPDCKQARDEFTSRCRSTWVRHFDRQYNAKKRVQRLLDPNDKRKGSVTLPQPYTVKP